MIDHKASGYLHTESKTLLRLGGNMVAGSVSLCDGVGLRSLSDIDLTTAANDPQPSASFSA